MPFLGACKLLAAVVLILPVSGKLKRMAYIGMAIDLIGAIYSRAAVHDTLLTLFIPAMILLLVGISWLSGPAIGRPGEHQCEID